MRRRIKQILCGLIGHAHGHRATEYWSVAKEWWRIDPSYGVYVCDRCQAVLPGQGKRYLQFR